MVDTDKLIVQIAADTKLLKQGLDEAQKEIKDFTKNTSNQMSNWKSVFAGVFSAELVLQFAKKAAAALYDFTKQSVKNFENFEVKMNSLRSLVGDTADEMVLKLQSAAKGTASSIDLITSANRALVLGIKENDLPVLLETSRKLGMAMGRDTTEAFNDITLGIARQSKLILDNLGIIVNAETAYERYADSIGKTSDKLTEAEKRTAFYREAVSQAAAATVFLGENEDTVAYQSQRLKAAMEDLKTTIGEKFAPAVKEAKDSLADFVVGLTAAIKEGRVLKEVFKSNPFIFWTSFFGRMAEQGEIAAESINPFKDIMEDLLPVTEKFTNEELSLAKAMFEANKEFGKSGNVKAMAEAYEKVAKEAEKLGVDVTKVKQAYSEMNAASEEAIKTTKEESEAVKRLTKEIEKHNREKKKLEKQERAIQKEIKAVDKVLQAQQKTLERYEDQLDKIQDKISKLSDPVFSGQRYAEEQIYQLERLIKERELEQLGMEKDSQEYQDMQEEIDFLNKKLEELRLTYELKYDDMRHQVEMQVQAHEDAKNGIYDSAKQVISALDQQWAAEVRLQNQIERQKLVIENTSKARQKLVDEAEEIRDAIEDINEELDELDERLEKQRKLDMEVNGPAGEGGGTGRGGGTGQRTYYYGTESYWDEGSGGYYPVGSVGEPVTSRRGYSITVEDTGNGERLHYYGPGGEEISSSEYNAGVTSGGGGGGSSGGGGDRGGTTQGGHQRGEYAGTHNGTPMYYLHEGGYVPETGPAIVQKGEYVIPADQVRNGFGSNSLVINIGTINASNAKEIAEKIAREIDARISW